MSNEIQTMVISFSPDQNMLLVGRDDEHNNIEVVNGFSGQQALDLFKTLTTVIEVVADGN